MMKRVWLTALVTLVAALGLILGLAACGEHVHRAEKIERTEATCTAAGNTEYWTCTSCGKYFSDASCEQEISAEQTVIAALGHDISVPQFDASQHWHKCVRCEVTDTKEAHTTAETTPHGSKPTCDICHEQYGETVPHVFDQKNTDAKYLKDGATCAKAAVYYMSCSCGQAGTETFESGDPLGHDFSVPQHDASQHWNKCVRCEETDTKEAHTFNQNSTDEQFLKSGVTCIKAAVYYMSCSCGQAGTETFESGSPLGHYFSGLNLTCDRDRWYAGEWITKDDLTVTGTCERPEHEGDQSVEITDYQISKDGIDVEDRDIEVYIWQDGKLLTATYGIQAIQRFEEEDIKKEEDFKKEDEELYQYKDHIFWRNTWVNPRELNAETEVLDESHPCYGTTSGHAYMKNVSVYTQIELHVFGAQRIRLVMRYANADVVNWATGPNEDEELNNPAQLAWFDLDQIMDIFVDGKKHEFETELVHRIPDYNEVDRENGDPTLDKRWTEIEFEFNLPIIYTDGDYSDEHVILFKFKAGTGQPGDAGSDERTINIDYFEYDDISD